MIAKRGARRDMPLAQAYLVQTRILQALAVFNEKLFHEVFSKMLIDVEPDYQACGSLAFGNDGTSQGDEVSVEFPLDGDDCANRVLVRS